MILDFQDTLVSTDIITEYFYCDLASCHGQCCVEGDAGAPVTLDEIAEIEEALPAAWPMLSAEAQSVIDRQGVAYTDEEGDLVTSIVRGRDCVFTRYADLPGAPGCCLCALESAFREGKTHWCKPASCALYPIRVAEMPDGRLALNYHRWHVCEAARRMGKEKGTRVYEFLREPLTREFGEEWYSDLCDVAREVLLTYGNAQSAQ